MRQPRYSKQEFARRGDKIYETQVRPQVEAGDQGKFVAIDIETGQFTIAEDTRSAIEQLRRLIPDAQPWMVRVGHRAVHRFGSRSLKDQS